MLNCPNIFPAGSNTEQFTFFIDEPSFKFTVIAVRKFIKGLAEEVKILSRD